MARLITHVLLSLVILSQPARGWAEEATGDAGEEDAGAGEEDAGAGAGDAGAVEPPTDEQSDAVVEEPGPAAEAPPPSDPVLEVLFPPNRAERVAAVTALAALGQGASPETLARLAEVLRTDPDPEVRAWAARGLASLGAGEAAHTALGEAFEAEPDRRAQEVISEAYRQTRPPDVPGSLMLRLGLALGLLAYAPTFVAGCLELIIGGVDDDDEALASGWQLLIPVVGPPIALLTQDYSAGYATVLGWLSAVFQAGGLALAIAGVIRRARALRRARLAGGAP